jgi:CBS domain containing-hemolysin-like protein
MEISLNPLVGIVVTLALIGFFQGIEIAFVSANRLNIELRKKQGKRSGVVLSYFVQHPEKLIGTIIVTVNLLIVIYGLLLAIFLQPFWGKDGLGINNPFLILALDVIIAALLLLIIVFFFKSIFRAHSDKLITNPFVINIISATTNTFGAIGSLFTSTSRRALDLFVERNFRDTKSQLTATDLEQFVEQSKEHSEEDTEFDTELFENALSFRDIKVRQCLIPRKEIIALEQNCSLADIKNKFIETKLGKLIIYNQNIDNIVGYVHQLDMFKKNATLADILHPIPAVPESMSASDLINKLTKSRKSIAWVVDEFGGTSGIVTMEDLLEELVGDIQDEFDTDEVVDKQLSKTEFIIGGRMELDHLREKYNLAFEDTDSETISGYIIQQHESIPKMKERIIIDQYEFEILNVSATRIELVKMKKLDL